MNQVIAEINKLRTEKTKLRISFVSGIFKVMHIGHIRLLRFAKEVADILVVAVMEDEKQLTTETTSSDRLESVQSIIYVDYACICSNLTQFLEDLKPDFVIKGKEFEFKENIEQKVLDQYGGQILFSSGVAGGELSDSNKKEEKDIENNTLALRYPVSFCSRHFITYNKLVEIAEKFKSLRVLVIGDLIIDEYITCEALGMSQEDPTIVVSPIKSDKYIGGAGIVAAHAAGLGANVKFISICGEDQTADFATEKLKKYNTESFLFPDASRPTTLKQRFKCKHKTMLRVSHLRQHSIVHETAKKMLQKAESFLPQTDLIIFSDFNYGCLPQFFVDELTEKAKKYNIVITADSQSSSQVGDVSRFKNASLLTPTEREARLAVKDFDSGLVVLATKLMEKAQASYLAITLGEGGLLVQADITDQIPALNPIAIDVAGAGDSFFVTASLALTTESNIWNATALGSIAAAIQVSNEGNTPLSAEQLIRQVKSWGLV